MGPQRSVVPKCLWALLAFEVVLVSVGRQVALVVRCARKASRTVLASVAVYTLVLSDVKLKTLSGGENLIAQWTHEAIGHHGC